MTVRLQIFDVEHGACALLTAENYARLMIDCGHNATTEWRPGTYLSGELGLHALDMLAITNYDEDHVSAATDLWDNVSVNWLWRNKSMSTQIVRQLKREGGIGAGMNRLLSEIDERYGGGLGQSNEPLFEGVERRVFYNRYPRFDDENNLSMALFLKCHGIGVLFTGDLERTGFAALLEDEGFRAALRETRVYVASHHGRESGCSDEVAALLGRANYVVISDKGYAYDTQRILPFYRAIAKGGPFRGETRRVLTTRRDGRIGFTFEPGSWSAY